MCLDDKNWTCAMDFAFFVIYDSTDMISDIDGVLGLGTRAAGGPSFIDQLYQS